VDDHSGGLVDDEDRIVLVENVERDLLGDDFGRNGGRLAKRDLFPGPETVRCPHGPAVYERVAVIDETPGMGA
jgi:hypothetical protein